MIISITRPPRQLREWEYYRQNRTIKLDFMIRQRQVLECFWKSDQKSTLIAGFRTHNERDTSRESKPVCIGDLHMGLISCLQCAVEAACAAMEKQKLRHEAAECKQKMAARKKVGSIVDVLASGSLICVRCSLKGPSNLLLICDWLMMVLRDRLCEEGWWSLQ